MNIGLRTNTELDRCQRCNKSYPDSCESRSYPLPLYESRNYYLSTYPAQITLFGNFCEVFRVPTQILISL